VLELGRRGGSLTREHAGCRWTFCRPDVWTFDTSGPRPSPTSTSAASSARAAIAARPSAPAQRAGVVLLVELDHHLGAIPAAAERAARGYDQRSRWSATK
jgi:hypothetical protein